MFVYSKTAVSSLKDFIDYWEKTYQFPHEEKYQLINNSITNTSIKELFDWKNGFEINNHHTKSKTVADIQSKVHILQDLRSGEHSELHSSEVFNKHFGKISPIWKIFLLHIINKNQYPIFDQHVYRAYRYILDGVASSELPLYPNSVFNIYIEHYRPYFFKINKECKYDDIRTIDKALWSFGRFLKSDYYATLT